MNLDLKAKTYREIGITDGSGDATVVRIIKKYIYDDRLLNNVEGCGCKKSLKNEMDVELFYLKYINKSITL